MTTDRAYRFQSWHLPRPYTRAIMESAIWNTLYDAATPLELLEQMEYPSDQHNFIQAAFRTAMEFPPYNPDLPWMTPNPAWIGEQLKNFLTYFFGGHPEALDQEDENKEHVGDGSAQPLAVA